MRVEQLRAGTLVNGNRVIGKAPGWRNKQRVVVVTYAVPGQNEPLKVTYLAGQKVPGAPELTSAAFLPASDTRTRHDGQRTLRSYPDRDETGRDRHDRRNAVRLAMAA